MMLMEHDDIIQVLTETEARSKSNTKRINELAKSYEAINKMATAIERFTQRGYVSRKKQIVPCIASELE